MLQPSIVSTLFPYSGKSGCRGDDCWQVVGGTSGAAPLWAGIVLLANELASSHAGKPLGLLNPLLYQLGASPHASQVFHDVTIGGNLYYPVTTPAGTTALDWGRQLARRWCRRW